MHAFVNGQERRVYMYHSAGIVQEKRTHKHTLSLSLCVCIQAVLCRTQREMYAESVKTHYMLCTCSLHEYLCIYEIRSTMSDAYARRFDKIYTLVVSL